jgi:hypothetical protein
MVSGRLLATLSLHSLGRRGGLGDAGSTHVNRVMRRFTTGCWAFWPSPAAAAGDQGQETLRATICQNSAGVVPVTSSAGGIGRHGGGRALRRALCARCCSELQNQVALSAQTVQVSKTDKTDEACTRD